MASRGLGYWAEKTKEEILEELSRVIKERDYYVDALKKQKEQSLAAVEQEEECHINIMMKRLKDLREQQQNLANQVEQEEEFLTNNLQKRLKEVNNEKVDLENQLEVEQEYIVNKLHKELDHLRAERLKLNREKIDLENQLEAEQEYIVNKLQKQVARREMCKSVKRVDLEKTDLQNEIAQVYKQLEELKTSVSKLSKEKIALENQMEMEEENIVNRLQRQLSHVIGAYQGLERRLDLGSVPSQPLHSLRASRSSSWDWRELPWRGSTSSGPSSLARRDKRVFPKSASSSGSFQTKAG